MIRVRASLVKVDIGRGIGGGVRAPLGPVHMHEVAAAIRLSLLAMHAQQHRQEMLVAVAVIPPAVVDALIQIFPAQWPGWQ